jgi:hypothetical protein
MRRLSWKVIASAGAGGLVVITAAFVLLQHATRVARVASALQTDLETARHQKTPCDGKRTVEAAIRTAEDESTWVNRSLGDAIASARTEAENLQHSCCVWSENLVRAGLERLNALSEGNVSRSETLTQIGVAAELGAQRNEVAPLCGLATALDLVGRAALLETALAGKGDRDVRWTAFFRATEISKANDSLGPLLFPESRLKELAANCATDGNTSAEEHYKAREWRTAANTYGAVLECMASADPGTSTPELNRQVSQRLKLADQRATAEETREAREFARADARRQKRERSQLADCFEGCVRSEHDVELCGNRCASHVSADVLENIANGL